VTACRRFEADGLLALEQGRPLDEHFHACGECRAALAAHQGLRRELSSLEPLEPPAGWEERVWARLDRSAPAAATRPWRTWAAAGLATAALVLVLVRPLAPPASSSAGLVLQVEDGTGRRGPAPAGLRPVESLTGPLPLGSRLVVDVSTGRAGFAELRVYRNDVDLLLQTSLAAGRGGTSPTRVALLLDAVGRYRAVLLLSRRELPAPAGSVDADVAARPAEVDVVVGAEIAVR